MAAPFPRRRNQEPSQLPRMAKSHRGLGATRQSRGLDLGRNRLGTKSTDIAIRTGLAFPQFRTRPTLCYAPPGATFASFPGMPMRRREFISAIGGAAVTWPLATRAQQAVPVIGFLSSRSPSDSTVLVDAFRQGLHEAGYDEGQGVAVVYRWAEGQYDRLPTLAAELVHWPVAVLVATGGGHSALAAKSASSTIPIVFTVGGQN